MDATIEVYSTQDGINLFRNIKNILGNIVSAEVKGSYYPEKELILENSDGRRVTFKGCFSAGYGGEGPIGTYTILNELDFEISKEFIYENENFKIRK